MSAICPSIAVIDDDEPVRKALRRLLRAAGLTVETFSGGEEFLASLSEHQPDCALLDLNMPDVSGFDVLERLEAACIHFPVIVLTGNNSAAAEECALRGGAVAYHHKPVNDRVLLDAITAAVEHPPTIPGT
jgi:FixJ family two-component response regulator